jgi:predicted Zn-dependent peptidase
MTIVVVGDIERDELEQLVDDELGSFSDDGRPAAAPPADVAPLRASHARSKFLRVDGAPNWQIHGWMLGRS